jgi:ribosomal protein L40E
MTEPIVCNECGARNPSGADWCGQCFASLSNGDTTADVTATEDVAPAEEQVEEAVGEVESTEGEAVWVCSMCETSNPLEAQQCSACGTSIYTSFGAADEARRDVDPQKVLLRSILFPGLGHTFAGQSLLGAAIVGLALMALGFGIALVVTGVRGFGVPLVVLGIGIWIVAALDAVRIAAGDQDSLLLRPRVVTALVGLVLVMVIAAALTAQGSSS